ncbi:hypothetical protein HDF24_05590 [Mucilaginibacter sp. X4EP1]|uniref:hypothetical protein n=1 Tax=Mucilaginibacter sp. X4EP1 TaxID=2723092 RepID=UPI002166FACC|nr:hypothetical protein [Mucilaginibacter sp. X4EP1]MCS3814432.1 hypothetical protein [Mucilaginibacter sp. X4EP1]
MPNIKFNYLYRDSGNYKKFGSVVFSNPTNIELAEIEKLFKSKLIDELWFYANEWNLPELFTENLDFIIDPTWHEFEGLEYTNEPENAPFDLNELPIFK